MFVGFCIIYNVNTAGVSQEVQITVRDSALLPQNKRGCRVSLARIPQRVNKLGPELYTTIFVVGCLLVKERPQWCPYCTLLSHGHISYLLTGCLEAEEAGYTTSKFPQNSYATPSTMHPCFLLQSFRPYAHRKADSDNLLTHFS